jgi:anti-sigma-K factor RskA
MNTQDYISSGILEQYVAGTLSPQETKEVECMSHIYPEIQNELRNMQLVIEGYVMSQSVTPPASLRNKILSQLKTLDPQPNIPVVPSSNTTSTQSAMPDSQNVESASSSNKWKWLAIVLGALSLVLAGVLFKTYSDAQNALLQIKQMTAQIEENTRLISAQKNDIAIMNNPSYKKVILAGVPTKSPESLVSVYWNQPTSDVYISIKNLPQPAIHKQYQLWAIRDGKPVDMGMIPLNTGTDTLIKMKLIADAQAFAITLENEGGVENPTLTEMFVVGNT